jgi:hypothetical protein
MKKYCENWYMVNITSNPYQGPATITNTLKTLQEIMVFQMV